MNNSSPVYITGLGLLTAAGHSPEANWHSLLNQTCHLKPISNYNLSNWACQLGGELQDFNPAKQLPDRKLLKVISQQDSFGLFAAYQAIEHSQLLPYRDSLTNPEEFNDKTGVYVGSPGNKYLQQYDFLPLLAKTNHDMGAFADNLFNEVHPMWLLRILPNNVLAYTGIHTGFKGPNHNFANHAVSGMQALIEAFYAIQAGQIERAVVVAYDLGLDPQALFYYDKLGLLSPDGLRPFDTNNNGTILADGAAAIVLESQASAKARQAKCFAQLCGGASQTEGNGLFAVETEAKQLSTLMQQVMQNTQTSIQDLAFIVTHGNGNKGSDNSEAKAISRLGPTNQTPPATAFKWSMGHTLVASGLVDTVLATLALKNKQLPGIASLTHISPAAKSLNIYAETRPITQGDTAIIINRGFASMNACLAIKACEHNLS